METFPAIVCSGDILFWGCRGTGSEHGGGLLGLGWGRAGAGAGLLAALETHLLAVLAGVPLLNSSPPPLENKLGYVSVR